MGKQMVRMHDMHGVHASEKLHDAKGKGRNGRGCRFSSGLWFFLMGFGVVRFYRAIGLCRRPILSGLLCLFSFLGVGPICDEFRIWASNLIRVILLSL